MKRLAVALLTLSLLLALAACGKKDPPPAGEPPVQSEEPSVPEVPPADNEPAPPLPDPEQDGEEGVTIDLGENGEPASGSAEISVSHKDVTLFSAGETFTLSVQGVQGIYAATYVSADPAVAEVDGQLGVVTAVAPGTTKVTAHVECGEGQFDFACIVRCSWKAEEPGLPASGEGEGGDPAPASAQPGTPAGGVSTPTLSGFYAALQGQYEGLDAMMVMDGELLDNYYPGLNSIAAVEEVLIQETMVSISNRAVGLVKLSDNATQEDILRVQSILQGRITAQADGGAWYPESCETWGQGVITSVSNTVGMFVYPDGAQEMADLFTDSFGS